MDLLKLKEPFASDDIEWRIQQSGVKDNKPWGMCLAYVTNRAIMERLDSIVGPGGWKNEFKAAPDGGILCGISIFLPLGPEFGWVTKWDGASNTDIEAVKGGLSNAMKRAAVQWGIGRYLYKLETGWANFNKNGKYSAKIDKKYYKWDAPNLPDWATPGDKEQKTYKPQKEKLPPAAKTTKPKGLSKKNLDWLHTFCETHQITTDQEKRDFMEHYGFTTSIPDIQFEKIKKEIEAGYKESKEMF